MCTVRSLAHTHARAARFSRLLKSMLAPKDASVVTEPAAPSLLTDLQPPEAPAELVLGGRSFGGHRGIRRRSRPPGGVPLADHREGGGGNASQNHSDSEGIQGGGTDAGPAQDEQAGWNYAEFKRNRGQ